MSFQNKSNVNFQEWTMSDTNEITSALKQWAVKEMGFHRADDRDQKDTIQSIDLDGYFSHLLLINRFHEETIFVLMPFSRKPLIFIRLINILIWKKKNILFTINTIFCVQSVFTGFAWVRWLKCGPM